MVETVQAGEVGHDDERRRARTVAAAEKALLVEREVKADDAEAGHVDEGLRDDVEVSVGTSWTSPRGARGTHDAPERVLDGRGQGLARVGRLGGGEADELGAGEREGGRDEHGADALEAVGERARVLPVAAADVLAVHALAAADVEDDSDDDEDDDDGELEARRPELLLGVTERSKDVDGDDGEPELRGARFEVELRRSRRKGVRERRQAWLESTREGKRGRTIVIQAAIGTCCAPSQYWTVMPAAVISRGRTTAH